jgi:hypothetical protein
VAAELSAGNATEKRTTTAGKEFARRFSNLLCELRLQTGIHQRIEKILGDFVEEHPNVRASYLARTVDESYFSDGSCGWEATARPKLQGLVVEGENLYEFLAFAQGVRIHTTPLNTIMNVEELWLETAPAQPFVLRVCLYHSFPATTILYAPDGDSQDAAVAFLSRLKYLRGF